MEKRADVDRPSPPAPRRRFSEVGLIHRIGNSNLKSGTGGSPAFLLEKNMNAEIKGTTHVEARGAGLGNLSAHINGSANVKATPVEPNPSVRIEVDRAGRQVDGRGKLVGGPANPVFNPRDPVTLKSSNIFIAGGICAACGVKHAAACPRETQE
jgi:hypothetical protein